MRLGCRVAALLAKPGVYLLISGHWAKLRQAGDEYTEVQFTLTM